MASCPSVRSKTAMPKPHLQVRRQSIVRHNARMHLEHDLLFDFKFHLLLHGSLVEQQRSKKNGANDGHQSEQGTKTNGVAIWTAWAKQVDTLVRLVDEARADCACDEVRVQGPH